MTSKVEVAGTPSFRAASLALLRRIVKRVAVRYHYPPPAGYTHWSWEAVDEWLLAKFLPKKGVEVVVKMQLAAASESSLTAMLTTTVHNVFRDESRATVVGKMISRLDTLLDPEDDISSSARLTGGTPSWTLDALGDAVFDGDWSDLLRAPALRGLPVLGDLKPQGPTSAADALTLRTAARAVLTEAGGAVRAPELAKVLVTIYELEDPDVEELGDQFALGRSVTASPSPVPDRQIEHVETARAILAQLDVAELQLLPHLDKSVAVIRKLLPNVSAPGRRLPEVRDKLRNALKECDEPDAVIGELLRLADNYSNHHHEH